MGISLPKSDLIVGLFDLVGFFFNSATRKEEIKSATKNTYARDAV
jgi:hypothetical protein